jgi:hypothetical protein
LDDDNGEDQKRPDITVRDAPGHGDTKLLIDLTIVQAFKGSQMGSRDVTHGYNRNNYGDRMGRSANTAWTAKDKKYSELVSRHDHHFLPFVLESNGYLHPAADEFISNMAKMAGAKYSFPEANMRKFFLAIISVALQRSLSEAILQHSVTQAQLHQVGHFIPPSRLVEYFQSSRR